MKKEMDKEEIIKIMKRQMIALLLLLTVATVGFLYMTDKISELDYRVRTLEHELDYTKYRIEELEKK